MKLQNKIFLSFAFVVVLLSFQNCGKFAPPTSSDLSSNGGGFNSNLTNTPISAAAYEERKNKVRTVFRDYCVSCHNVQTPNNIVDILDLDALVRSGHAVIGSPQLSPVYTMLVDEIEPRNGRIVDHSDREIVRAWLIGPIVSDVLMNNTGTGDTNTTIPATYANVNSMIISMQCTGCHNGTNGRSDMRTYAGLTGGGRVVANSADTSTIVIRTNRDPGAAGFMPQNGTALTVTQKSLLRRWIQAGALSN